MKIVGEFYTFREWVNVHIVLMMVFVFIYYIYVSAKYYDIIQNLLHFQDNVIIIQFQNQKILSANLSQLNKWKVNKAAKLVIFSRISINFPGWIFHKLTVLLIVQRQQEVAVNTELNRPFIYSCFMFFQRIFYKLQLFYCTISTYMFFIIFIRTLFLVLILV